MKPPLFSCLESRVANNGSLYGRFLFGPLPIDLSLTVATILRRSLLNTQATFTIVSAEIEGATHEYASLSGINESVLEILLNLGEIVLTSTHENFLNSNYRTSIETASFFFAFIKISGPCTVEAKDINWPRGISCVKPNAYIATLSSNETLAMRVKIACSTFSKKRNNHNIENIKPTFSTSASFESVEKSNQLIQRQFNFLKFQRNTKYSPATMFSSVPSENQATSNKLGLHDSHKIQDYTPLSLYSSRKRNVVQSNTQSQFQTNLNSSNPSYLAKTNNEIIGLENKKLQNTQNIFIPKTQGEEKSISGTFQNFPKFTNTFVKKSLKKNLELLGKNKNGTVEESIVSSLLSLPKDNKKQSFTENPFFDKNLTNSNTVTVPVKESIPLTISSSSYPVEKVNFLIERDDDLVGYRHRIIFEVWTNGSISPRQAIFDSIGSIIKLVYSFREPVRYILNAD